MIYTITNIINFNVQLRTEEVYIIIESLRSKLSDVQGTGNVSLESNIISLINQFTDMLNQTK